MQAIIKVEIKEIKIGEKFNSYSMDDNLFYDDWQNHTEEYDGPENYNFGEKMDKWRIKDCIATSDFLCCYVNSMGESVEGYGEDIFQLIKKESGVNDFFEKHKEQIINDYKLYGPELFYKFIVEYHTYSDHNSYHGEETKEEIMPLKLINFKDILNVN